MSKRINACNLDLRPEAFKLAPVFLNLADASNFQSEVGAKGRNRSMLGRVSSVLNNKHDPDLRLIISAQTTGGSASRTVGGEGPSAFLGEKICWSAVEAWLASAGLDGMFRVIAPFADVASGKPARDLFLLAAGIKVMWVPIES